MTRYLGGDDAQLKPVLVSQDVRRCPDLTVETASALIGKSREETDLCIPLDVISRVHARIDTDGENVYLTDENSTNGTFVNNERLAPMEKRQVCSGDYISFATVHFKLQMRDY